MLYHCVRYVSDSFRLQNGLIGIPAWFAALLVTGLSADCVSFGLGVLVTGAVAHREALLTAIPCMPQQTVQLRHPVQHCGRTVQ